MVEASHGVREMMVKEGKLLTEEQFLKDCVLNVGNIVSPEKRSQFSNISLSANTVGERITLNCCEATFLCSNVTKPNVCARTCWLSVRTLT